MVSIIPCYISQVLNNLGCVLFELNKLSPAQKYFEDTLQIQRRMLRTDPQAEKTLVSIATTLSNISSIQVRLDMFEEASISLEEALLIQQSVLGDEHNAVLKTIDYIDRIESYRSSGITKGNHIFSASNCYTKN